MKDINNTKLLKIKLLKKIERIIIYFNIVTIYK